MLRQILVGVAVSVCNIAIHACLTTAVIWAARIAVAISTSRQSFRLITVMIVTVSLLMVYLVFAMTLYLLPPQVP